MRSLLLAMLVPAVALAAPVKVEGRLLTHEGKAPPAGIVRVTPMSRMGIGWASNQTNPPSEPHLTDGSGRFSFTLEAPGFYALWFEAPQHEGALVPLWLDAEPGHAHRMTVQLAEAAPPPLGSVVEVRYRDGEKWLTKRMTEEADGTWTFRGTASSDTVRYFLMLTVPDDVNSIFNPSESRFSTENSSLASLAEVKDGTFTIHFDPKMLPKGSLDGRATVRLTDPVDAKLFALLDDFHAGLVRLSKRYRQLSREDFTAQWQKHQEAQVPLLLARANDPKAPAKVRAVAAVVLFHLKNGLGPEKELELSKLAPPDSLAWAAFPLASGTAITCTVSTKEVTTRYLREMAEKHPDPEVRGSALAALARQEENAGHVEAAAAMFRRVSTEFSDAKGLQLRLNSQRKTFPLMGKPFPAIELPDVSGKKLGADALNGRFTLVEFSAIGCGACTELVPQLRQLREAVPTGKLRMVTVTLGVDAATRKELLAKEPPQPWDQLVMPDDQHAMLDRWNVTYFPTLYLVDPKGVVVATDRDLRTYKKPLTETVGGYLSPAEAAASAQQK